MPFKKQLFLFLVGVLTGLSGEESIARPKSQELVEIKELKSSRKSSDELKKPVLSGTKKKLIKSYLKNFTSPFPTEKEIDFIISGFLMEKSKKENQLCPAGYDLQNDYSLFGKIDFLSLQKNSCPAKEAQEIYHLTKTSNIEKTDKKNQIRAYHDILKWMLDIFFYPFIPGGLLKPVPDEYKEAKLGQACPSCSFRFEYYYRYREDGSVSFDVRAICSDKKRPFSKVKQDSYIVNHWKCAKKPESRKN